MSQNQHLQCQPDSGLERTHEGLWICKVPVLTWGRGREHSCLQYDLLQGTPSRSSHFLRHSRVGAEGTSNDYGPFFFRQRAQQSLEGLSGRGQSGSDLLSERILVARVWLERVMMRGAVLEVLMDQVQRESAIVLPRQVSRRCE